MILDRKSVKGPKMKKYKIIVILGVLLLSLIVILQNSQPVSTEFLFWTFTLPGAFLLFLTFMFGFVAGLFVLISFEGRGKKKREIKPGQEKKDNLG
jgi:uncharacterized integral membrane protein